MHESLLPINDSGITGLDQEQQKIVEQKTGLWLLTGEPGTGKTTLLMRWVTSLIASRVARPEEILVLACTRRAVTELRERFILQLGEQAARIPLFTFSAFCLSLLQEKQPAIQDVYNAVQREQLLGILYPQLEEKTVSALGALLAAAFAAPEGTRPESGSKPPASSPSASAPGTFPYTSGLPDHQLPPATGESSQPIRNTGNAGGEPGTRQKLKCLATGKLNAEIVAGWLEKKEVQSIYQEENFIRLKELYLEACRRTGVIDRAYLPVALVKLLEQDKRFLSRLQSRLRYLAIDEFQEVDAGDYHLLKVIFKSLMQPVAAGLPHHYKGALLAGDIQQALDVPAGTVAELWPALLKEYAGKAVTCSHNYRSAPAIQAAVRTLATQMAAASLPVAALSASPAEETPVREPGRKPDLSPERIKLFHAKNELEEVRFIVTMIEELARDFRSASSPVGSTQGSYAYSQLAVLFRHEELGRQILPYLESAGIPVSYHTGPQLLADPPFKQVLALLRLLVNPQDLTALKDVLGSLVTGFKKQTVPAALLWDYLNSGESLLPFFNRYQAEGRLTEHTLLELEELIGFLGLLKSTCEALDVAAGLELVFDKYVKIPADDQEKRLIKAALLENAGSFRQDIKGFVRYLCLQEHACDGSAAPWGVNLLSFAAAKGREFPVVFIMGAEEGITPVTSSQSDMEEERHLFYIALSRAREKLFISTAARRELAGRTLKLLPSRFINLFPATLTDTLLVQKKKQKLLYEQLPLF